MQPQNLPISEQSAIQSFASNTPLTPSTNQSDQSHLINPEHSQHVKPPHQTKSHHSPSKNSKGKPTKGSEIKVHPEKPNKGLQNQPQKPVAQTNNSKKITNPAWESKRRKITAGLLITHIIVNLGLLVGLVVFHFHGRSVTLDAVGGALEYIAFNVAADPIMDIQVIDDGSSAKCPSGYSKLQLGTWPGTVHGCSCRSGMKRRTCSRSSHRHIRDVGCVNYASRDPIEMFDWRSSLWCVKRAVLDKEYVRSSFCPAGFKKCSPGICMKNSLNCPITAVNIQNSGSANKLAVGTGYVVTGTTANEMPIIDIAITPNNIPCFSTDYFAKGSTSPYALINENEGGCSKYGLDTVFSKKVDTQKQDLLFGQNSFPSSVMNLPGYAKIYDHTDAVLASRRRMDLLENDACLNIEADKLNSAGEASINMDKVITRASIYCIVLHGFILLVMSFALNDIIFKKKKASQIIYGVCSYAWMTLVIIIGFLEYIGLVVMFCFVAKDWNKMYGVKKVVAKLWEKEFYNRTGRDCVC